MILIQTMEYLAQNTRHHRPIRDEDLMTPRNVPVTFATNLDLRAALAKLRAYSDLYSKVYPRLVCEHTVIGIQQLDGPALWDEDLQNARIELIENMHLNLEEELAKRPKT